MELNILHLFNVCENFFVGRDYAKMQHDKTGAIFVFMKLIVSRESISTKLMGHYILEPLESHRVWRIIEPMRIGTKKSGAVGIE